MLLYILSILRIIFSKDHHLPLLVHHYNIDVHIIPYIMLQFGFMVLLARYRKSLRPLSLDVNESAGKPEVKELRGPVIAGTTPSSWMFITCFTSLNLSRSTHNEPVDSTRPTQ
jgi:hypothetical protein